MITLGYWFILIICLVISISARHYVTSTFKKYSDIETKKHISSNEFVDYIFRTNQIYDVSITSISGELSDYYSDKDKQIALSESTYGRTNVAAVGVAAHEAGHALQYNKGYFPVFLRSMMVPAVNIGSRLGVILAIIGVIILYFTEYVSGGIGDTLINLGIILYSLTFIFTVVTLPVEFNASRRAISIARECGEFSDEEVYGMKKVLTAAAMTYVASMVVALLYLLRFISIFGRRRR